MAAESAKKHAVGLFNVVHIHGSFVASLAGRSLESDRSYITTICFERPKMGEIDDLDLLAWPRRNGAAVRGFAELRNLLKARALAGAKVCH